MSLTCFGKAHLLSYAVKLLIIGVRFTEFYCTVDLLDMVVRIINPWFFFNNFKKKNKTLHYKTFDSSSERGVVYSVWSILASYNLDSGGKVKNMASLQTDESGHVIRKKEVKLTHRVSWKQQWFICWVNSL